MLVALLAPLAVAGCHDSAATPSAPPPAEVGVVTVAPGALPLSYEFVGEVQPIRRVEVRARVDGVIESRPFTEGAFVKAGDVLYRLERIRTDAAYRNASARLANASRTLARLEPLLEKQAVTQQEVDDARTEKESAQAALDEARKDREDAIVRAEISGRVGRTLLEVGARVTGPADLLTTVEQLDPVYVGFRPSSQDLLRWRGDTSAARPDPARQRPPGPRGPPGRRRAPPHRQARLRERVARSDDGDPGVPRHLHQPRPAAGARASSSGCGWRGSSGRMRSPSPGARCSSRWGVSSCWSSSKGDTVRSHDVTPGPWSGESWIIERGLAPGDRVVVDGVQKAMPGSVVHPVPAADSAAADSAGGADGDSSGGDAEGGS